MAILYKPSVIKSHFDPSAKKRYIARPCKRSNINTYDLSRVISERTTLNRADIIGVLYALEEVIPELILDNKSVHLKPLGIFSVSFKSDVEDEESGITQNSIKDVKLQFRPDSYMKSKLKNATFKKSK